MRINPLTAGLMVAIAVVVDGVQAAIHLIDVGIITVVLSVSVDWLIGIGAWMLFYFWFKLHGVSFVGPRQLITLIGAGTADLASGGIFPAWVVGVLILIAMTNAEDVIEKVTGKKVDITGKAAMASGRMSSASGAAGAAKVARGMKPPPIPQNASKTPIPIPQQRTTPPLTPQSTRNVRSPAPQKQLGSNNSIGEFDI